MKRSAKTHLNRFSAIWRLPISSKVALLEAVLLMVFAQILIKATPYSWWRRLLGPINGEEEESNAVIETEITGSVAWAVHTAARYVPWNIVCLPRAMAAKWMLSRRDVASTLFLGIRRTLGSNETDLHAWLRAGRHTVTGGDVADQFTVIACFGEQRSQKAALCAPK